MSIAKKPSNSNALRAHSQNHLHNWHTKSNQSKPKRAEKHRAKPKHTGSPLSPFGKQWVDDRKPTNAVGIKARSAYIYIFIFICLTLGLTR